MQNISYFNNPKYADVTLILNDGVTQVKIYAHRPILANKSVFFDRLFDFHPDQNEFVLSIGEYQVTVDEALKIIEDNIYRGLPVTFEQIQNYSLFLNALLIDGKTYNREFMTTTRFVIKKCSVPQQVIVLLDITHKNGFLTFEVDPANKRLLLIVDKYLCRNDEFLDYLMMLTNDISEDQITQIRDEGLILDNTNQIQNVIKGLYAKDLIVDNGHTYSNILAKCLFDQHFGIVDPIYRRTRELSGIKMGIEVMGIMGNKLVFFEFELIKSTGPNTPFLNIRIPIYQEETSIGYSAHKVILNEHANFFLIIEWLKIFTPLDPIDNVDTNLSYASSTLVKLNNTKSEDLAALLAIVSYIYAAGLLPTVNTYNYPHAEKQISELKHFFGLDITNEYISTI